jgi:alkanesulfonate monooxygenase SsuD/methylene tetrahydromethanopterin reductase-like flavin-dependent oxidoreductase (luciferase family)/hemerythrin-like domain-containing protein
MPDYGHDLLFGCFLPPVADRADAVVDLARLADRVGLDLVSLQDHPYQPSFLDTWTLLSVIAARTDRVRVLPNVVNLPLRPPAVLARAAASLDILSGGRVELGLGAGAFPEGVAAMGGPRRGAAESVEALAEAIAVIRALWTPGPGVRLDGAHYRLAGARPGPAPAHPIGIWLGAYRRRMLRLTGRLADGWLPSAPYAPPERLTGMNRVIDEAATAAGRDPAAVRRLYNVAGSFAGRGRGFLEGPAEVWAEQLAELAVTEGISGFILMVDLGAETHLRRFAEEVAPAVRELVAKERAGAPPAPAPAVVGSTATEGPTATAGRSATAGPTAGPEPGPAAPAAPATTAATSVVDDEAADGGPGVVPTPAPSRRWSELQVWDESARPRGPRPAPGTVYPARGRALGQHLVDVHDHFRQELDQLRDLVRQVAEGETEVGAVRSALHTMALRQNRWTLGTYCEQYCRAVTAHHTLEDTGMFPQLRRADPRLAPVIDRLHEEHEAIAGVLDRVDAALVAMVSDPAGGVAGVQAAVDLLTDTLLSHLSYEEHELVEPLARLATG